MTSGIDCSKAQRQPPASGVRDTQGTGIVVPASSRWSSTLDQAESSGPGPGMLTLLVKPGFEHENRPEAILLVFGSGQVSRPSTGDLLRVQESLFSKPRFV